MRALHIYLYRQAHLAPGIRSGDNRRCRWGYRALPVDLDNEPQWKFPPLQKHVLLSIRTGSVPVALMVLRLFLLAYTPSYIVKEHGYWREHKTKYELGDEWVKSG